MPTRMSHIVIDAADPPSIARFWSRLLTSTVDGDEFCVLTPR